MYSSFVYLAISMSTLEIIYYEYATKKFIILHYLFQTPSSECWFNYMEVALFSIPNKAISSSIYTEKSVTYEGKKGE